MKRFWWILVPLVMLIAVNAVPGDDTRVDLTAEGDQIVKVVQYQDGEAVELKVENGQLVLAPAAVEKEFWCSSLCVAWFPIKCTASIDDVCQYSPTESCWCNVYGARNN